MKLNELISGVQIVESSGGLDREVASVQLDSRKVEKGSLFIAKPGPVTDGHEFIGKAIEKGAVAIVCEKLPAEPVEDISFIKVKDSAAALGQIASNWYGDPTSKLKLIGITGTNGKTTTATLIYNLLTELGYPVVLVSTIKVLIGQEEMPSALTTPDVLTLNEIFAKAVETGCEYGVMEVSSIGIHQKRIAGLRFEIGVFSNLTHDHLDYHHSFENYLKAKKEFFDHLPKDAKALTNTDDRNGIVMVQNSPAKRFSYALKTDADFRAKILEDRFDGMTLLLDGKEFWTPLIGRFNAYNILAVYAVARLLGFPEEEVLPVLSSLGKVEGRFQSFITKEGIIVIVDYAHTPDALANVLETIRSIRAGKEKLITVVGCGGDRDKSKRPEMAYIAGRNSDLALLTSDNPRTEDPEEILRDMEKGIDPKDVHKTIKITDRKEAIKTALKMSEEGDIILIAGKGHETYQEINGVRHHFNDMETAKELAEQLKK